MEKMTQEEHSLCTPCSKAMPAPRRQAFPVRTRGSSGYRLTSPFQAPVPSSPTQSSPLSTQTTQQFTLHLHYGREPVYSATSLYTTRDAMTKCTLQR